MSNQSSQSPPDSVYMGGVLPIRVSIPWSKQRIPPLPSVEPQCPHIIPSSRYAVIEHKGDIYIVSSPSECPSCKALPWVLYLFSTTNNTLTPVETTGTKPKKLANTVYTSTIPADDNKFIVFASNLDVFSLDLEKKEWTRLEIHGSAPPPRDHPSIAMVGSKFFLFGGKTSTYLNELWLLDLTPSMIKPSWTLIAPSTSKKPPSRFYHVCIPYEDHLIIFGGQGSSGNLNDTWCYNIERRAWSELLCTGSIPTPRRRSAMALVDGIAYLFGGYGGTALGDLWALNIPKRRWFVVNRGCNPESRYNHSMFSAGKKIYLFGGNVVDKSVIDVLDTGVKSRPKVRRTSEPPRQTEEHVATEEVDD